MMMAMTMVIDVVAWPLWLLLLAPSSWSCKKETLLLPMTWLPANWALGSQ